MFFIYFMLLTMNITDKKYNLNTTITEKTLIGVVDFYDLWIIHSCLADWIFLTLGIRQTAKILLNDLQVYIVIVIKNSF